MRAAVIAGVAGSLVAVSGVTPLVGASAAGPVVTTTTVLSIEAPAQVGVRTPVRVRATVTPDSAQGRLVFSFVLNGVATDVEDVVGGQAELTTDFHPLGTQLVTARFVPGSPDFLGSVSATEPLVVTTVPTLELARAGAQLPAGALVYPGETVQALLSGFVPGTLASLMLGGASLPGSVAIDGYGRAQALVPVPPQTGRGEATLTAVSGALSASVRLVITNRPIAPGTSQGSGSPAQTPAGPVSVPVVAVVPAAGAPPDTGTTPALAHTGGDPLVPLTAGLVLLALGAAAVRSAREPVGRHS